MSRITASRIFRGLSPVAFAATVYAAGAIDPIGDAKNPERVSAAAAHGGRLALAALLLLLSSALFVPTIVTIMRAVRDRGRVLVWIGGVCGVLGALGHAALVGYYAVLSQTPDGDRAQMVALLDRIDSSTIAGLVAVPAIAGFALGVWFLVLALARSRVLPAWVALFTLASIALEISGVEPFPSIHLAEIVGVLPIAWFGVRLLDAASSKKALTAEPATA